jgi:hypothetical protein
MAALSSLYLSPLQWTVGDVIIGARNGLYLNRLWERLFNYNAYPQEEPITFHVPDNAISMLRRFQSEKDFQTNVAIMKEGFWPFLTAFTLYMTFKNAENITHNAVSAGCIENNFFQDNRTLILAGTCTLIALNVITLLSHHTNKSLSDVKSILDKFLIVVWTVTPYVMMITNITLIFIEAHYNPTGALVKLVVTGITLLDMTSWMPESFSWYLDFGAGIPLDLAALYYDSNYRISILLGFMISGKLGIIANLFRRTATPQ